MSQLPAEGAVLERREEGVELGQVGAVGGLHALDGGDAAGELLLEGKGSGMRRR
ncbi:MAG: hypothetical protein IPN17_28010 [Deltaproteobacteria bacterium]|nr:hypothetical protein [Deltaproteobacteria bacterium]